MLARAWRVSPADLRACTVQEVKTMWAVLEWETKMRERHG